MAETNLLAKYREDRSANTFEPLVKRYVGLVYASARRQLMDPHLAEDVTQAVFMLLTQKVDKIAGDRELPAWLLTCTRYIVANLRREIALRNQREQKAAAMKTEAVDEGDDSKSWSDVLPLLDEGLAKLRAGDRDVLLLRFFENLTLRQIGDSVGVSEDAAEKRVARAIDRLRELLMRQGVAMASGPLAAGLSSKLIVDAPTGLATAIVHRQPAVNSPAAKLAVGKGKAVVMTVARMKLSVGVIAALLVTYGGWAIMQFAGAKAAAKSAAPTGHSTTAPAAITATEAELSGTIDPPLQAMQFNSKIPLRVEVQARVDMPFWDCAVPGQTPAQIPIAIAAGKFWCVAPNPTVNVQTLATEINAQRIPGLDLQGIAAGTDLSFLQNLKGLRVLVANTSFADSDLKYLQGSTSLQEIYLERCTKVTDAGMAYLGELKSLQKLDLGATSVTDAGLKHLRGLRSLELLSLYWVPVTEAGLQNLEGMDSLRTLFLGSGKMTDAGLEHLRALKGMRILSLSGEPISDLGLSRLSELTNLEEILLNGTKVTDAGMQTLKGMKLLQKINLSGTSVTDASLKDLAQLHAVRSLDLRETQITDAGVPSLEGMTSLRELILLDTNISSEGAQALRRALPDCTILDRSGRRH